MKKNTLTQPDPIEVNIFNKAIKILTKNNLEIHDKDIQFDQKDQKWFGHIKYFGNSTVDINLNHNPKNKKFYVSLFLDNDYSEDGCPECLETDKIEAKKELKPLLDDLDNQKIQYSFNWE